MKPPRTVRPLPRYTLRKLLKGGVWGYFFNPPSWARKAGCPVQNDPLGSDYEAAVHRAETVLLPAFDSWRTAGASDLVPIGPVPNRFDWAIAEYRSDRKYTKLDPKTRRNHEAGFRLVSEYILKDGRRLGAVQVAAITTAVADAVYEKLLTITETDEAGNTITRERRTSINHAMKSCRRAWNVAARRNPGKFPAINPFSKMGLEASERETPTAIYEDLVIAVTEADRSGLSSMGTAFMVSWEWLQREEHIFTKLRVDHYRPKDRPNEVKIVHPKNGQEVWVPLFDEDGAALFPELMERMDAIKRNRIGGLMFVRDWSDKRAGIPLPWATEKGGLTYAQKRAKAIILAAGLRTDLSFTSFRHGGLTELGDADLTDTQIRALSRQKSAKVLPRYVKRTERQIIDGTRKRRAMRTKSGQLSE